jgi:hypothetical protein
LNDLSQEGFEIFQIQYVRSLVGLAPPKVGGPQILAEIVVFARRPRTTSAG